MMNVRLTRYLWHFFGLFLVGYTIGLTALFAADHYWHINLHDLLILSLLSATIPYYICRKFTQKEGRFLNAAEQKKMTHIATLIAFVISITPTLFYAGVKLWFGTLDMTYIHLTALLGIYFIFYYGILRLVITANFQRARKRHEKKQQHDQDRS
ncbi:MAG TPA: ABZJ_00895 family protein [Gammaproteobacteria bacterium]|nr:ABZJ_00895 family protein [Gammaproteobacteria bacterium]